MSKALQALGWVGVACVLVAVAVRFLLPDQQLWWWLAVVGLGFLIIHLISERQALREFAGKRQTKYGALAGTSVLLALGILIATNYILSRQNKRWDLTSAQQYSLSDQTRRVLESLESPISILVFGREEEFPRFRDRLDEYAYTSSEVTVEYIDVDKNPIRARQYEIQSYGTIVFDYEGRVERVVSNSEQELTNALIKAVEGEERTVYFTQGHGERDPNNEDRNGYSTVREALRLDNFGIETVVIAQTEEIPDNASAVIVAGPSTDFFSGETDVLRDYLEQGGKVLLMLDPSEVEDAIPQPNLISLVTEWGAEVGNDVVVDASGMGQLLGTDASVPVAASYPPHAITENFNLLTAFPLARSIRPVAGGTDGRIPEILIETGPRSWAEVNLAELATGEVQLNEEAGDVSGPVPIAVTVSQPIADNEVTPNGDPDGDTPPPESRLVVFGDSDFASNGAIGIQGNRDLILNAINWLAQQENLIAIRPREPEDRRITLTADAQTRIAWLSLLMLPGLILTSGVYTWWRRRR
ncbi:MAG TPA: hypothetical protein EYO94_12150 [Acidobacteria bacterium]|nr:hypothetical protein [Acidobacteriota bacterium]